jgi:hypothetical protein
LSAPPASYWLRRGREKPQIDAIAIDQVYGLFSRPPLKIASSVRRKRCAILSGGGSLIDQGQQFLQLWLAALWFQAIIILRRPDAARRRLNTSSECPSSASRCLRRGEAVQRANI